MSTPPTSKKSVGKPTSDPRQPDEKPVRDKPALDPNKPDPDKHDDRGTPTIAPGKQDAEVDHRGVITDDNEAE